MIEDETYYWVVSRYIHLNPYRAGMVEHPGQSALPAGSLRFVMSVRGIGEAIEF